MATNFSYTDMNGGELPIGGSPFKPEEIKTIFRVVNDIFKFLPRNIRSMPVFGVPIKVEPDETISGHTTVLKLLIKDYDSIDLYETNGTVIFDIRGPSGGVITKNIFYLIPNRERIMKEVENACEVSPAI